MHHHRYAVLTFDCIRRVRCNVLQEWTSCYTMHGLWLTDTCGQVEIGEEASTVAPFLRPANQSVCTPVHFAQLVRSVDVGLYGKLFWRNSRQEWVHLQVKPFTFYEKIADPSPLEEVSFSRWLSKNLRCLKRCWHLNRSALNDRGPADSCISDHESIFYFLTDPLCNNETMK